MKHFKHLISSVVLFAAAASASAASVQVTFDNNIFGHGYDGMTLRYGSASANVGAGAFSGKVSNLEGIESAVFPMATNAFVGYCYDLYEHVWGGRNVTYTVNLNGGTERTLDFLGAVNYALGGTDPYAWLKPTSAAMSAAIQLGIWESLYDTTAWDIGAGFLRASGVDSGTQGWIKTFFDALGKSDALDTRYVMTLEASGAQDLLTGSVPPVVPQPASANDVPEPASLALVGLALAGLGVARRRRA